MYLTHRQAKSSDVKKCLGLFKNRSVYEEDLLAAVPSIWQRLLADRSLISRVIEDFDRARETRLVGFGASVFVTDQFVHEIKSSRVPFVGPQMYRLIMDGRSPVLDAQAVRRANSGAGLNVLVLYLDVAVAVLGIDETNLARLHLIQALMEGHRGYNIKELLVEGSGEEDFRWMVGSGGFRLRKDYHSENESGPPGSTGPRPFLAGVTREEALSLEGIATVLAPLFVFMRPRFFFKEREQQLLQRALMGETDREIASSSNISLSAVKKRWETVFDRVAAVQSELLPLKSEDSLLKQTRGPEKRQRLLQYLQRHPEELRPFEPEGPIKSSQASRSRSMENGPSSQPANEQEDCINY